MSATSSGETVLQRALEIAVRLGLLNAETCLAAQARLASLGSDSAPVQAFARLTGLSPSVCEGLFHVARTLSPGANTEEAAETLRLMRGAPTGPERAGVAAVGAAVDLPTVEDTPPSPDAPTRPTAATKPAVPGGRPLPPGAPRRLGPYVLISELGRGGMGAVYLAEEQALARRVALKVMLPRFAEDPVAVERFYREARACAGLNHPHVVSVLGFGEDAATHYYAMEYVEGRSAAELLREGPVSQERAARLVLQAAQGLGHAHQHGVVHRDVKPQNLMVTSRKAEGGDAHPKADEDVVKVADFGLARVAGALTLTQTGVGMGTPLYMAPEQFAGARDVGPPADVYSLGVTLYEMLTGRPPFWGEDAYAIQKRVEREDPVPPRRLVQTVDRDLEAITLACLEKDPTRRYADAGVLALDLDRWVRGEPVHARRVSWPGRLWRKAVRHRRVVAPVAASAAVVLGMLAWTGARAWRTASEVRDELRAAATLEANGEQTDDASRREALWKDAQGRLQWVTGRDPGNLDAQRAAARLKSRLAELRSQQDLAGQIAALDKAGRVDDVMVRFADLAEGVLWPMEAEFYDDTIKDVGVKRAKNAERWKQVERFMKETPDDAPSQATMWACAGWARRLAGYEAEGLEWMRRADDLDAEVPYGALLRALVYFSKYVDRQPLPSITLGVSEGVDFGPAARETEEMAGWRVEMERALVEAEGRLVWGKQEVRNYRAALESMRAMQGGRYGETIEALTRTIGRRELAAIRFGMLLARGKARYLTKAFEEALGDLEEAKRTRGGQAELWIDIGLVRHARADVSALGGADPRDGLRAAIADFGEAWTRSPEEAGVYLNRGVAFSSLGDAERARGLDPLGSYEKAIADYGEAVRRSPEEAMPYSNRGTAFARLGEAEGARGLDPRGSCRKAIGDFGEALKRDPEYTDAYGNRGTAFTALGEAEGARGVDPRGSYEKAIVDFVEALKRSPEDAVAYLNRGSAFRSLGEAEVARGLDPRGSFEKSIADYGEALKRNPDHAEAYNNRGNALVVLGEAEGARGLDPRASHEKAIADFGEALARNPEYAVAYGNRGAAFLKLGEAEGARGLDPRGSYEKAVADCGEALKRNPEYAGAYNGRAAAFLKLGEAEDAQEIDPRGSYEKAVADCGEALKRNPEFAEAYNNRGTAFSKLGKMEGARGLDPRGTYQKAIADFGEALKRNPDIAIVYVNRGSVFRSLGEAEAARGLDPRERYEQAIADCGEALKRNPEDSGAYNNRGIAFTSLGGAEGARGLDPRGSYQKAIADFDAAIMRNPSLWQTHANKGLLFEKLGEAPKAVECYEAALRISPGQLQVEQLLARARSATARQGEGAAWARPLREGDEAMRRGDYEAARPLYEEALAQAGAEPPEDDAARAVLANAHYDLACIHALASAGRASPSAEPHDVDPADAARLRERSFQHLRAAVKFGWSDAQHLAEDADLAPLHGDPRWDELLRRVDRK